MPPEDPPLYARKYSAFVYVYIGSDVESKRLMSRSYSEPAPVLDEMLGLGVESLSNGGLTYVKRCRLCGQYRFGGSLDQFKNDEPLDGHGLDRFTRCWWGHRVRSFLWNGYVPWVIRRSSRDYELLLQAGGAVLGPGAMCYDRGNQRRSERIWAPLERVLAFAEEKRKTNPNWELIQDSARFSRIASMITQQVATDDDRHPSDANNAIFWVNQLIRKLDL